MGASGGKTRAEQDFPFLPGGPSRISPTGWLILLALTSLGFTALMVSGPSMTGGLRWIGVGSFVLFPLWGLRLVAGPGWKALFPRPTARDLWIGLAWAPAALLASMVVAFLVTQVSLTDANPAVALLEELRGWELVLFAVSTLPQLLGEELVTVIAFLAILATLIGPLRTPRRSAIVLAWIGASLIFGALHLATYQWHVVQALVVIGSARLVLFVPYLITKNLWSSTLAHIVNDWAGFGVVLALSALKTAP